MSDTLAFRQDASVLSQPDLPDHRGRSVQFANLRR